MEHLGLLDVFSFPDELAIAVLVLREGVEGVECRAL